MVLAINQVQSVLVAAFTRDGYFLQDNMSLPLPLVVGLPLLAGVVAGWMAARLANPAMLKLAL